MNSDAANLVGLGQGFQSIAFRAELPATSVDERGIDVVLLQKGEGLLARWGVGFHSPSSRESFHRFKGVFRGKVLIVVRPKETLAIKMDQMRWGLGNPDFGFP